MAKKERPTGESSHRRDVLDKIDGGRLDRHTGSLRSFHPANCVETTALRWVAKLGRSGRAFAARSWWTKGMRAWDRGQHSEARRCFLNAQRLDTRYAFPEQPSTEYLSRLEAAGRVLTDSHDYDTAMRILREAITLEPNNPEAFYALGRLHEDRHDDDEAIDYYTEAIRRNPRCDDYLFARGAILFFRYSDINKAVEDLSLAIRLDPKRADAHCVRAAAYIRLGDEVSIQSARDDVSIARSLRPREERITRLLQQLTAAMDARDRQREQRGKE